MPRSGVIGTYSLPPNTNNQAPNTPISSSMFNAFASDVQQTFNDPTPVAYGGTGQAELVLPSDEFGIKDGSNGTKRVDFDLSGITTSTTRTLTIQDADGTIALLSDIGSLQQDVSDLLNGAVRGDVDQSSQGQPWRDQAMQNLGILFTREFVSAPITLTSGGTFALTHGLGSEPKLVSVELHVVTAVHGFAVGDKILLGNTGVGQWGTGNSGFHIRKPNATQIVGRFGSNPGGAFIFTDNNTGQASTMPNANVQMIVRAWA